MYSGNDAMMLDTEEPLGQVLATPVGDLPSPYVRSAPLLLHDILDQSIYHEWPDYANLKLDATPWAQTFTKSDLTDYLIAPGGRKRYQTKHVLLQTGAQYGQYEQKTMYISSCCLHCCHHFRFTVRRSHGEQSPCKCPGKSLVEGFHQFIFMEQFTSAEVQERYSDTYQIVTGARFRCTSDACSVMLELEVSQPRIDWKWISILRDRERINANLQKAKKEDPERFKEANKTWLDFGVAQVFTYAKDLVSKAEVKRLTKRNKRFAVVMGPEMYDFFRWMGYEDGTQDIDGVVEEYFIPRTPEPATPITKLGTYRAFIEDVQNELECLMRHDRMRRNDFTGLSGRLAIRNLEDMLHCDGFTFIENKIPLSWSYRFIGAMPNFSTTLLEDTFNRHVSFDPLNKACYVDALHVITMSPVTKHGGHGSVFYEKVKGMIDDKYDYLLATWDLGDLASDDEIIMAFQYALREKPEQVDTCFELLRTFVKQSRKSARLNNLLAYDMPYTIASNILAIDSSDTEEIIAKAHSRIGPVKAETIARAVLSAARVFRSVPLLIEAKRIKMGMPPPNRPVGLENIGNTCYLNSILQYLYTLIPIQQLVNSYQSLALDESAVDGRLIGASKTKVSLLDLLVSQQFVKELKKLFYELQTVPVGPTQPTQALANTIVLSDSQLLHAPNTGATAADPIDLTNEVFSHDIFMDDAPLPLEEPTEDPPQIIHMSQVQSQCTITPGITSQLSTETLIDSTPVDVIKSIEEDDKPVYPPAPLTEGISESLLYRDELFKSLQAKHEFSMQQQDVEEIFGRIIDRIQAGIASSGCVYDDIQNDFVIQTLFFRMVTYTYKKDENGKELPVKRDTPEFYRYITAFPAQTGSCTLYDALDRTFDREEIEGPPDMARYTAICDRPPPVLHILIQRTQDNGGKNLNSVILEDELSLDRYMDVPEGSELMKLRKASWALRKRLRMIESSYGKFEPTPVEIPTLVLRDNDIDMEANTNTDDDFTDLARLALQQEGSELNLESLEAQERNIYAAEPPEILNQQISTLDRADADRIKLEYDQELKQVLERNNELFKDMYRFKYKLHAIFCHSGRQSGGHYWVWIRDFKRNIWRKFNDTRVEEQTNNILDELNKGSEPYYLCYVLESETDAFVDTPERAPRTDDDAVETRTFEELDKES